MKTTKTPAGIYNLGACGILLTAMSLLSACGFQTYVAKPLEPAQNLARYRSHDPNSEEFRQYLVAQGYTENNLPFKDWGIRELTLSALYFHPELDVARAQWRAAQSGEITAAQKPNPGISGDIQNHSKTDGGISPWTYGLAIDIPLETGGKRQARIDRATNLSEAARIDIAQTAWKVRRRLLNSLIEYSSVSQQVKFLEKELNLRKEIVSMLEARFSAGMISSVEIGNARLQLQKSQQILDAEKGRISGLRASLASDSGLTPQSFTQLHLQTIDFDTPNGREHATTIKRDGSDEIQEAAMLNRLDIRAALARYAAAEAKLRLEIARQYPDLILSPGYSYDQGDRVWSLGLSTLISLLNKNQGLIAEARGLREVEAAQFEALQAKILSDLELTKANYYAALDELEKAKSTITAQQVRTSQTERQFSNGYADRLELSTVRLEELLARQNLLTIEYKIQRAASALEDVMQRPLEDDTSMPADLDQALNIRQ